MSAEELVLIIKGTLNEVQEMGGHPAKDLSETESPIGDLVGFDSLNGVEVTLLLATRLKCEIPEDVNLFVSEDGSRATTVAEIAERILILLPAEIGDRK